ncbi:hypothetical protein KQI49_03305 [Virgibacillus sp. MSJ-26]|uniref:DUF6395 domain-containing protein n=1 Tax=Virgibacillus sp. MSJ-26 TaxID=2841522 RepID=UPI001C0F6616|nr:DUF6395 domain-containing protein [Virgibacillus sp. MSJ-26]MBU5465855.1 hypothetical protein [Virgibacillus sp. MSJ-26]
MIINHKCENGRLIVKITPENDDPNTHTIFNSTFKTTATIGMDSNQFEIHLPSDWTIESVHPDVFALAMIAAIHPFIGSTIRLPRGVSPNFHNLVKRVANKRVLPVNAELSPRKAPSNAVPALTFSGGIDSTAAAILLPENTHLFYFDRLIPKPEVKTLLNQEAAYYACDRMAALGRPVHKIKTDMQYLRKPVGFNSYLADAVPPLLLADYYGFDSVGHGQTLEIGYQIGHLGYKDCKKTEVGDPWFKLLTAVDLTYTLPTIGLSEVITTRIVNNSSYHEFAQACSRGKIKQPCMNCFKCFRKSLLEKVMRNQSISDSFLDKLFNIRDAKIVLNAPPPIYFASILAYITAHYNGNHPKMLALKKNVRGDTLQVDWMNKWYSKSQEFLAPKYRNHIKQEILKHVEPMTPQDIKTMKQSFSKSYFN